MMTNLRRLNLHSRQCHKCCRWLNRHYHICRTRPLTGLVDSTQYSKVPSFVRPIHDLQDHQYLQRVCQSCGILTNIVRAHDYEAGDYHDMAVQEAKIYSFVPEHSFAHVIYLFFSWKAKKKAYKSFKSF